MQPSLPQVPSPQASVTSSQPCVLAGESYKVPSVICDTLLHLTPTGAIRPACEQEVQRQEALPGPDV